VSVECHEGECGAQWKKEHGSRAGKPEGLNAQLLQMQSICKDCRIVRGYEMAASSVYNKTKLEIVNVFAGSQEVTDRHPHRVPDVREHARRQWPTRRSDFEVCVLLVRHG
jgi:hypothetical protein